MKTILSTAILGVSALAPATGVAGNIPGGFSSLVVFGDSLSDTGRVKATLEAVTGGAIEYPPAPYNDGRFTGGDTYVDILADMWGLTSDVDLLNYAFGGARAASQTDVIWDLGEQVNGYRRTGTVEQSTALTIVNIGGNDVAGAATAAGEIAGDGSDPAQAALARQAARAAGRAAANAVRKEVTTLGNMGLESFMLFNLADVGATPRFSDPNALGVNSLGLSNARYATIATNSYNNRLANRADVLRERGLEIFEVDANGLFEDILDDPGSVGLVDATSACGTYSFTGTLDLNFYDFSDDTCDETDAANADVPFWDDLHPNQILHEQYALAVEDVLNQPLSVASPPVFAPTNGPTPVPLPLSAYLLAGGVLTLAGVRRLG